MTLPESLDDWLAWQQRQHPDAIALGLDRVRIVRDRLGVAQPAPVAITVGGTNGKGSTVAFLDAMLRAAHLRVGTCTSPHLLRYNERVRIDGMPVSDAALVDAFARIEAARGDVPLTYFEYGTLAALLIFAGQSLDVAVLEVGLGGRLDAINVVDADAAIVTSVDLDHQEWLGHDRDAIGREKAGIFREGRPAIVGDRDPPAGLLDAARKAGARVLVAGRDFDAMRVSDDAWKWHGLAEESEAAAWIDLPRPALRAPVQTDNAAAAIAALRALRHRIAWNADAIAAGVRGAHAAGRVHRFAGPPEVVVDVAHNPQAARALADWLREEPAAGRTLAVFGALADKDVEGIVRAFAGCVDGWFLAGLDRESPRGLRLADLRARVATAGRARVEGEADDVRTALAAARGAAGEGGRVLAFGSFFVAAAALDAMGASGGATLT